jgi:hypothetical protein
VQGDLSQICAHHVGECIIEKIHRVNHVVTGCCAGTGEGEGVVAGTDGVADTSTDGAEGAGEGVVEGTDGIADTSILQGADGVAGAGEGVAEDECVVNDKADPARPPPKACDYPDHPPVSPAARPTPSRPSTTDRTTLSG